MRVNVTYSIELNEIKQLIQELLLKAEDDLEQLQSLFLKIKTDVENDNEQEVIAFIEKCRNHLSSIDHSLFDCGNILAGYHQASSQLDNLEQELPNSLQAGLLRNKANESR